LTWIDSFESKYLSVSFGDSNRIEINFDKVKNFKIRQTKTKFISLDFYRFFKNLFSSLDDSVRTIRKFEF